MPKSRKLADIRARATQQDELRRARAALRRPWASSSHGWHEAFLDAVAEGATISAAARAAGVSRNAVYWARENVPGFEHALRLMLAARGSTMKHNRSTKIRSEGVRTLPTGTVQNSTSSGAPENMAADMRNLFPLAEESAIFAASPIPNREAACP